MSEFRGAPWRTTVRKRPGNVCVNGKALSICFTEVVISVSATCRIRDLSRPPRGVITPPPSFHATPPNHLKFKGGYQGVFTGGVVIVMEWVINVVKY